MSRPRRLAYVTTAFPTMAFFVEDEVHRLRASGVEVQVFALRSLRGRTFQPEHRPLLAITRRVGSPLDPRGWAALLMWLLRRPQVLIREVARMAWASRASVYALAGHLGYLPAAARIAREIERQDFDHVHGAWAHFPGTVAYLASRLTGRPFSLAAHAGADLYRTQAFLAHKVRCAEFTVACVRGNAEMLRRLAGPEARIECLYHGVDLERFAALPRARCARPTLLAVGRLAPAKGFDLAIRALAEPELAGTDARLVMVGEGPERERLEQLAKTCGVESRVEFHGELPQREVLARYREAWVLVAPSRVLSNGRRDGIPNVVIEGMASGLPCLATRAAGLEEAVVPGETGALIAAEDVAGLAREARALLADPDRLDRLGARARQRVRDGFDAAKSFERLLDLLGNGSAPSSAGAAPRPGSAA